MDCEQASERLPWLLNGTLDAAEEAAVRAHLRDCPRCRADWDETRSAARVFASHLPATAIVDLAWERPAGMDPEIVKAHLGSCASCREELALARESRVLDESSGRGEAAQPLHRRARVSLAWLGVAASLAAAFASGLWWGRSSAQRDRQALAGEQRVLLDRVASLEDAVARLREAARSLEAQMATPFLNVPVFELVAGGLTTRSGSGAPNELSVAADARFVVLVLTPESRAASATVEIRDARGVSVWSGDGLRPGAHGGYTLAVPAGLLAPGRYSVALRTERPAGALLFPLSIRRH